MGTWNRGGESIATVSLVDVAPTVLHSLGEPPTEEMDGRVVVEVFADARESLAAEGSSARDGELDAGLSEDEEALVEERLRGLGYIE